MEKGKAGQLECLGTEGRMEGGKVGHREEERRKSDEGHRACLSDWLRGVFLPSLPCFSLPYLPPSLQPGTRVVMNL